MNAERAVSPWMSIAAVIGFVLFAFGIGMHLDGRFDYGIGNGFWRDNRPPPQVPAIPVDPAEAGPLPAKHLQGSSHMWRARQAVLRGDREEAMAEHRAGIANGESPSGHHVQLGTHYFAMGQPARALVHFDQADSGPGDASAVGLMRAQALQAAGQSEESVEVLRKLVSEDPRALAPRIALAGVLIEQGRHEEVLRDLEAATTDLEVGHTISWAALYELGGLAAEGLGDYGQAKRHYSRGLGLCLEIPAARDLVARLQGRLEKLPE